MNKSNYILTKNMIDGFYNRGAVKELSKFEEMRRKIQ